jgi:outer membrane protein assembly factor BamB
MGQPESSRGCTGTFAFLLMALLSVFVPAAGCSSIPTRESDERPLSARYRVEHIAEFEATGPFFSSPCITLDNRVVIGSQNGHVYFLSDKGTLVARYETGNFVHATAGVLSNGVVAVGSYDKHVYLFNSDGELLRSIRPGGYIFTSPVELPDGRIVFGTNRNRVVFYDLGRDTKQVFKTGGLVHGSPVLLSNGDLAIGANDRTLYILSPEAERLHSFETEGWIMHSKPLELSNGNITVGSYDRHLYILTPTAELVTRYETGGLIHGSPLETPRHRIVFGSTSCASTEALTGLSKRGGPSFLHQPFSQTVPWSSGLLTDSSTSSTGRGKWLRNSMQGIRYSRLLRCCVMRRSSAPPPGDTYTS